MGDYCMAVLGTWVLFLIVNMHWYNICNSMDTMRPGVHNNIEICLFQSRNVALYITNWDCAKRFQWNLVWLQVHHDLAKYHEMGRFVLPGSDDTPDLDAAQFHEQQAAELGVKEAVVTMANIYLQRSQEVLPSITVDVSKKHFFGHFSCWISLSLSPKFGLRPKIRQKREVVFSFGLSD